VDIIALLFFEVQIRQIIELTKCHVSCETQCKDSNLIWIFFHYIVIFTKNISFL